MGRKKNNDKLYNPNIALLVADTFMNHAISFFDKTGTVMGKIQFNSPQDIGLLVASATQLSLALELYLKALRMILKMPIPTTHDLWRLYNNLPITIKSTFEDKYNLVNSTKGGELAEFSIIMLVSDNPNEPTPKFSKDIKKIDLNSILKRSKDAFQTWRYIHEGGKSGEYVSYNYEFYRLRLICDIVRGYTISCKVSQRC